MKKNKTKDLFLEQLRKTPIVQVACEKVSISRNSVYRWRSEDQEFSTAMDLAIADGHLLVNDLAESKLIGALKDGNMAGIMYWLKHHHPSYKTKIEIEGQLNIIEELSPEQKEQVRQALQLAELLLNKKTN